MIFSRYNLLKQPKVVGEIIADIGIGVLASVIFDLTQGDMKFYNLIDGIGSLLAIIEGNLMKYKEEL